MTEDRPTPHDLPTPVESLMDQTSGGAVAPETGSREEETTSSVSTSDHVLRDSTPGSNGPDGAAGGMGVSSERVGHTGPGQHATDGLNATDPATTRAPGDDTPPEQSTGGPEDNPHGLEPKAGYPAADPRSEAKPFQTRGNVQG